MSLGSNRLKRINSSTFKGLDNLKILLLNINELSEIEPDSFQNLERLNLLNLSDNRLREMDRECFRGLKSIEVVQLYNTFLIALSFFLPNSSSANLNSAYYDKPCLEKYGYHSDWNAFLMQFPGIKLIDISTTKKLILCSEYFFSNVIENFISPLSPVLIPRKLSSLPLISLCNDEKIGKEKQERQTLPFINFVVNLEDREVSQSSSKNSSDGSNKGYYLLFEK